MSDSKIKSAAFRHCVTGKVYETGTLHDIENLPSDVSHSDCESGFVTHGGKFLSREEAMHKSLKEYDFDGPTPDQTGQLKVVARTGGKPVGELTFSAKANSEEDHPHHGYHMIGGADVSPPHRGAGVYGRMLQVASAHVKKHLGSKGLVSAGDTRSEAATGAWEKLASKAKVTALPGAEPDAPDFFMHEKSEDETSQENIDHEFDIEFERWFSSRINGTPYEPRKAYDFNKAEEVLSTLSPKQGNLDGKLSESHQEIARAMAGYDPEYSPEFVAARFLAGGELASEEAVRTALILYDTDFELAALRAYGLPRNEQYREMLRATVALKQHLDPAKNFQKSDIEPAVIPRDIKAVLPEGEKTAEAVIRAQDAGKLTAVQLDRKAKHSKGTAIAEDPVTGDRKLLKPGSGKPSPAAGVRDELANQSQREVAFAKVVDAVGMSEFYPKADLLVVDDQEVACLDLLPLDYVGLDKLRQKDKDFDATKLFEPYVASGELYRWALLDWIMGNPDRHANNLMVSEDLKELKLIDHGSAFAGIHFDPAHDPKSFVPFYLRAWAQDKRWSALSVQEREDEVPRMNAEAALAFGKWIDTINEAEIVQILEKYGITPTATMDRLHVIKAVDAASRADELIGLWCGSGTLI